MEQPGSGSFEGFVESVEPRLRHALVATYGRERGREATAEALAWAWEHWERVSVMSNPAGYLYRVGQSRSRSRRRPVPTDSTAPEGMPWVEPALDDALARLSDQQRIAVVLVHGFEWRLREVSELLGVSVSSVQTHLERGLRHLRDALEVHEGA